MKLLAKLGMIGATAAIAATTLTACDSGTGYDAYCINTITQIRYADSYCYNSAGGYGWYYAPYGRSYPAVGSRASGGSTATPTNGTINRGALPTTSGKVPTKAPSGATKVSPAKPPKVSTTKGGNGGGSKPKSGGGYKAPAKPPKVSTKK